MNVAEIELGGAACCRDRVESGKEGGGESSPGKEEDGDSRGHATISYFFANGIHQVTNQLQWNLRYRTLRIKERTST